MRSAAELTEFLKKFRKTWAAYDLRLIAYSLSFSTLISIIPLLILALGIFKWTGFLEFLYPKVEALVLSQFQGILGPDSTWALRRLLRQSHFGGAEALSFVVFMISGHRLVADLESAAHRIWKIKIKRGFILKQLTHWLLILSVPISLGLNAGLRWWLSLTFGPKPWQAPWVSAGIFFALFFAINKWLPAIKVHNRAAIAGGIVSTALMMILTKSFSSIATQFFIYSKFYGSLASFVLLLMWILLSWYSILLGIALSSQIGTRFRMRVTSH